MSAWQHNNVTVENIDPQYVGFIYLITQISTGKMYVGKKKSFFKKTSIKTVTLKSGLKKKKKIRSLVPSDWPEYFGSSDALKIEVEKSGKDDFKREILRFCKSDAELSYYEAKEQFDRNCLLLPDLYWNSWIMVRTRRDHLLKTT